MNEVNVFVSCCTERHGKQLVEAVNQHLGWKVCAGFGLRENHYDFPVLKLETIVANYVHLFDGKIDKPTIIIDSSNHKISELIYYDIAYEHRISMVCATENLRPFFIKDMQSNNQMKFIPVFQEYNMDIPCIIKATEFLLEQKPGYYNMDSLCK